MSKLRAEFLFSLGISALLGVLLAVGVFVSSWGSTAFIAAYVTPFVATAVIGWWRIESDHTHRRLGLANWITVARLGVACFLCGLAADITPTGAALPASAAWWITALAAAAIVLDGVDGWIARRSRNESAFGARFDMEVDAFLILVLSVITWQLGKAGPWVLLMGAMRYLFWLAGFVFAWFASPLPDSFRRKAACVIAGGVLTGLMAPVVTAPLSAWLAAATLAVLVYSFLVDGLWLARRTRPVARPRG